MVKFINCVQLYLTHQHLCLHLLFLILHKVPGPVQGVQVAPLSSSAVELTWSDPNVTNGRIRGYSVTVRTDTLNGSVVYMTETLQRNVTATGLRELDYDNKTCEKYTLEESL